MNIHRIVAKLQSVVHLLIFGFLLYLAYAGWEGYRLSSQSEAVKAYDSSGVQKQFGDQIGKEYTVQMHNGVVMLSSLAAEASATQKVILTSSLNKTKKIGAIAIILALLQLIIFASKSRTSRPS